MTKKRTTTSGKRKTRKLGVKKETLKDLGAIRGKGPKGGGLYVTALCRAVGTMACNTAMCGVSAACGGGYTVANC